MAAEALSASLEADFQRGFVLPPASVPQPRRGERVALVPLAPAVYTAYLVRHWREQAGL